MGNVVIINQLCIPKNLRTLAKQTFDFLLMKQNLLREFLSRIEKTKRVVIGFREELDTAGLIKLMEGVHDFGRVLLELVHDHAGKGISHPEFPAMLPDKI